MQKLVVLGLAALALTGCINPLDAKYKDGYEEGYEEGREQGREEGRSEAIDCVRSEGGWAENAADVCE
jgi:flagellar biosynthesis/type III secretory pathway protein FliH